METTQNQLETQSEELKGKEEAWSQKVVHLKQEQQTIALQVNALMGKRADHLLKIDTKSQAQYDRLLRIKRGVAVSVLKQGVCQACRVSVTSNIIRETQSRKIVHCTNCGRILYASH